MERKLAGNEESLTKRSSFFNPKRRYFIPLEKIKVKKKIHKVRISKSVIRTGPWEWMN